MTIALWTVVDQGFDVEVYATAYRVAQLMESRGLACMPNAAAPDDLATIGGYLNRHEGWRFYEPGAKTWKFKVQAQYNIK